MFTGIIEEMGEVVSLTPTDEGSAVLTLRAGAVLEGLPDGGSLAVNGVCLTQAPVADSVTADPPAASPPDSPSPAGSSSASPAASRSAPGSPAQSLFVAHVMGETLTRTTVGGLRPGDPVNLERCPRAGDRFDGHIVQGHVDGTGRVVARVDEGDWVRIRIAIPSRLAPFTAEKGSIALDGVSLTLSAVSPASGADEPAPRPAPGADIPDAGSPTPDADGPASGADHWVEVGLIPATLAATRMGVLQVGDAVNVEVDIIAKYAARLTDFRSTATTPITDPTANPTVDPTAATADPTPAPATADAPSAAPATAAPHEGDLS